jgi:biopolymer transport protein ExbB
MNMSMMELWHSMGWFAKGIVFTLAIMSVWSLTVMFQKWWTIRRAQAETKKFAPEFSQFLEEDNLTEAIRLAEGYKRSHVARVLGNSLAEVKPLIMDGSVTVADINSAERAVEREMLMTIVDLKRGLGVLATTGATAPFVGLLGTTMGIVNAFTTKIDNLTAEMTYTSKEMIDYLIKGVSGEFGRSRFTREFSTGTGGAISQ